MREHPVIGESFESVLAAAQSGAEWAFEVLFCDLQPPLLRYLQARAGPDAEDLASATWLDTARGIGTVVGGEEQLRGWIFTIARRRLADARRAAGRRPVRAADVTEIDLGDRGASVEDLALEGRLGDEAARRIVASLPAEQAEIVLLRVVSGLSVDEVARAVGRKPGTVRVMQHRALRRLATVFEHEDL